MRVPSRRTTLPPHLPPAATRPPPLHDDSVLAHEQCGMSGRAVVALETQMVDLPPIKPLPRLVVEDEVCLHCRILCPVQHLSCTLHHLLGIPRGVRYLYPLFGRIQLQKALKTIPSMNTR